MVKERAKRVIKAEAEEIAALAGRIDAQFEGAVEAILRCGGKVIVSGMGKSGIIAQKIASTFASTGTPAFFLHPAEAYHGDLGMAAKDDLLLVLSNSGETDEVLKIVPFFQDQKNPIVAMTGRGDSTLAKAANFHIDCSVSKEACGLQLAPTSSTTAMLVMGDALAVSLMEERGFNEEGFARFHPGGQLGRRLLARAEHEMIGFEKLAIVSPKTPAIEVLHAISAGKMGVAIVCDDRRVPAGIVTDGDIRRSAEANQERFFTLKAEEMMSVNPVAISPKMRLIDAEELMDSRKIHQVIVQDDAGRIIGVLPYRLSQKEKR
ncbi:MAG: KpsF/GutQ family sugar-phosphate isomerase [Helicobacteraceae bacterium]|jgi:arabinose-5-phosphate isomerase|nr:KpsF/GutQ family sugar-phosphate isomerase [Helicobacteraceae bacterium]